MVRLVPTTNDLSASGFAHHFMCEIFPHYGFPLKIVSDRGTQWNSDFFKALCRRPGVELSMSTAFHPQTNGLVERNNEVVEVALRHYISADISDWDDMLPLVEFAMNSSYHEAIRSTPFKINRITLPANPFDVLLHSSQQSSTETTGWLGLSPPQKGERTYVQGHEEYQRTRRCVHAAKSRICI
jgi:hypothetical protein